VRAWQLLEAKYPPARITSRLEAAGQFRSSTTMPIGPGSASI
jgi:hypothetical protein